jgi:hypothetical protein
MSFTQDELQAFNSVLEQRLAAHRREMERAFDSRMNVLRRDFEQRLSSLQQDLLRSLPQHLSEQQSRFRDNKAHSSMAQAVKSEREPVSQTKQQFEELIGRALAAQLLAIEQLIHQHVSSCSSHFTVPYVTEVQPGFEAIEVQTELPWEELADLVDKALDQRLVDLNESVQATIKNMERTLSSQLHNLREDLLHGQGQPLRGSLANMQNVFANVEQLEQIIESMQVVMNANHTLLSNRLYHHQHQPPERAHPGSYTPAPSRKAHVKETNNAFPLLKEHPSELQQE